MDPGTTAATFHLPGEEVRSIWVLNPLRNWLVLFTPFGLGTTLVLVLLACLITKKGYIWFSGYKYTRDPRGFDILPDATHGSSGFLTEKEMEEFLELGTAADTKGMMGCNDLTSAKYIAEKCGKVTISVTNNQMPLMPLFSPVYTSTRPYSQTRSSVQRDLMLPDEVLRLDHRQCIALFQGRKPALLYKLAPEELPDYARLTSCRVIDYIPEWQKREGEQKPPSPDSGQETPRQKEPPSEPAQTAPAQAEPEAGRDILYSLPDLKGEDVSGLGMVEITQVRGDKERDEDRDIPPRR